MTHKYAMITECMTENTNWPILAVHNVIYICTSEPVNDGISAINIGTYVHRYIKMYD